MSIQITYTFATAAEAAEFLAANATPAAIPRPFEREPVAQDTPPEVQTKKPRAKKEKPIQAPEPVADVLTTDDLRDALKELMANKGAVVCHKLLEGYQVARVSELAPHVYPQFLADCKAANK